MPELPDVEDARRFLAAHTVGQRVERVEASAPEIVRNTTVQGLGRSLVGHRFEQPRRHGKWLLAATDGPIVVLHLGMTGSLRWSGPAEEPDAHDRVVFVLERGKLRLHMPRKFGGVWLAAGPESLEEITGPLGTDAAEVTRSELGALLERRRGGLKSALMDQRLLAGVGNLVADEVLWQAGLHPARAARQLDDLEVDGLHAALRRVLEHSVGHGRVPRHDGWLTGVRDLHDPACPRCGTRLEKATVAGRTTWFCPSCQG